MRTPTSPRKNDHIRLACASLSFLILFSFSCSSPEKKVRQAYLEAELIKQSLYPSFGLPIVITSSKLDSASSLSAEIRQSIAQNESLLESPTSLQTLRQTQNTLEQIQYRVAEARSNPLSYRLLGFSEKTSPTSDIPLERIRAILQISDAYYGAAKSNLQYPNPEQCLQAVQVHRRDLSYLEEEIQAIISRSPGEEAIKKSLERDVSRCKIAIKDYIAFCQSKYLNHQDSLLRAGNYSK